MGDKSFTLSSLSLTLALMIMIHCAKINAMRTSEGISHAENNYGSSSGYYWFTLEKMPQWVIPCLFLDLPGDQDPPL